MGNNGLFRKSFHLEVLLRYLLVVVFMLSAVAKLADITNTTSYISVVIPVGNEMINIALFVLIIIEFSVSCLLVALDSKREKIYKIIMLMLGCFIPMNLYMQSKGMSNCGCFGTNWVIPPGVTLLKNILLLFIVIFLHQTEGHLSEG